MAIDICFKSNINYNKYYVIGKAILNYTNEMFIKMIVENIHLYIMISCKFEYSCLKWLFIALIFSSISSLYINLEKNIQVLHCLNSKISILLIFSKQNW